MRPSPGAPPQADHPRARTARLAHHPLVRAPGEARQPEAAVDIHEYQAKELLANFGVAVPRGGVAYSAEQAVYRAAEIGGNRLL